MPILRDWFATKRLQSITTPELEAFIERSSGLDFRAVFHSHGFLYRAFIGSVSEELLKDPPCPIMVIPGNT